MISSKTDWASGSGTRDALWLSYHARSYLTCRCSGSESTEDPEQTHLIVAQDLIESLGLVRDMEAVLTEAAYLVGLLYGCKLLRSSFYIIRIFVWVMNEGEFAE